MKNFKLFAIASAVAALWASSASADCPEPTSTQGVTIESGVYTVSAQVQIQPVLWIANGGQETVSKIGTDVNKELARYTTWFWNGGIGGAGASLPYHGPWDCGRATPSRSAVDTDGNAYVANRAFCMTASVMKILTTGCIDRNNNGTCETSKDLDGNGTISANEMYPIIDDGRFGGIANNGKIESGEIRDERVAYVANVGGYNEVARALAIDKQGKLWVGMWNTRNLYKVDPANGATLQGPIFINTWPYGAAVDSKNRLFTAALGSYYARRIEVANPSSQVGYNVYDGYGVAVGKDHTGKEWVATSVMTNWAYELFDPDTLVSSFPLGNKGISAYGVSFDKNGHVLLSGGQYIGHNGATKARTDGSIVWTRNSNLTCGAGDQRGAIVDANNDVWLVALSAHKVCKYLANGTSSAAVPVGAFPYTYSDASGIGLQFSDPTGKVAFQSDAVGPNFDWSGLPVCFQGSGNVTMTAAAANTLSGLEFANPAAVALSPSGNQLCGTVPNGIIGRYIQFVFTIKSGGQVVVQEGAGGECTTDLPTGNQPPVAVCQAATVCANAQCQALASINGGSSDPDGDALTFSSSPAGPYGLGSTNVTLSVSDGTASANCSAAVTVNDCTAPALTCPANAVAECTGNSAATVDPGSAGAADNCSTVAATGPGAASYPLGTTTNTYSATDAAGNTGTCSATVTVADTTAPVINCPAPFTAECTGNQSATVTPGAASAADVCGAVSVVNPGTAVFGLGTTTIDYSATDAVGLSSTCSANITVADTTPPVVTASGAGALWPPNHKFKTISLADCGVQITDKCYGDLSLAAASATIACVSSDEAPNTTGDGNSETDIVIVNGTTVKVLQERAGNQDGRVYHIGFTVTDGSGNASSGDCKVTVPHDQGPKGAAVDSGAKYTVCK